MNCSQCGECCRYISFGRVAQLRPDAKEYLLAKGCIIDQGFILLPHTCPHLKTHTSDEIELSADEPCKKTSCDIHDHAPKLCQQFNGKRFFNHALYWVPKNCTLSKPEVKNVV